MTPKVIWLPEAIVELGDAIAWYTRVRPELGLRFETAIDATLEMMCRAPLRFAVVGNEHRRAGVYRFPYSLFFIIEQDCIVVTACFRGKRHPRHWQLR